MTKILPSWFLGIFTFFKIVRIAYSSNLQKSFSGGDLGIILL
jgi:hypothetical protein